MAENIKQQQHSLMGYRHPFGFLFIIIFFIFFSDDKKKIKKNFYIFSFKSLLHFGFSTKTWNMILFISSWKSSQ